MSHAWLARLARRLGLGSIPAQVTAHLEGLQVAVAALEKVQAQSRAGLEKVEKELSRAGKEQFKANLLAQGQQEDFKVILEHLRQTEAQREREWAQLREQLAQARSQGRVELVQALFPTLDGLGEALEAGRQLLKNAAPRPAWATADRPELARRLRAALRALGGKTSCRSGVSSQAMAGWLEGLELLQERLLEVLAAEGVRPIEAEGKPFDPHRHLAIEAAPAAAGVEPNTIVAQTRRGYALGERVLRYAEVVVARTPAQPPEEREPSP